MNQFLKTLRLDPQFKEVLKTLKSHRPALVLYDSKTDNVRQVVESMAMQKGFDLCIAHLESK